MRLHTEELHVEKSTQLVEREFQIKATAEAFSILSSGLYSDKILAIVRELSCNAWDAHVMAKNLHTKFEVKLPSTFDPTFYVKDFGTGLSDYDVRGGWFNERTFEKVSLLDADKRWKTDEKSSADEKAVHEGFEQVGGLYNTYFDSTKNKRNDQIGALGLGSKSPFSYASTFSIESRIDGMRRMYTAFINDKGVPTITFMGEEKTTELSGMTIAFATKQGDTDKFLTAARRALMYFDPQPNVIGTRDFTPLHVEHLVKGTNWATRKTDYYANMSGAFVMQGFVAYPIDRDQLSQSGLSKLGYSILGLDIDFVVPLGQVNPAASREALSYTPATIANLCRAVDIAAAEMRASIQKSFDDCKSVWEARLLQATFEDYNSKMRHLFTEHSRSRPFTYKGVKIESSVAVDLSKITNTQFLMTHLSTYKRKAQTSGRWEPTNVAKTFTVNIHPNTTVLVDDVYKSTGILTQYMNDVKLADNTTRSGKYTIVLKGVTKTSYSQKEVNEILALLGNPTFQYVSALPYKKAKTASTYRARKSDEVVVWTGYPQNGGYRRNELRRVYSRLCWEGEKIDPYDTKTERYYVELDRFTIMKDGREAGHFDIFLSVMKEMGILPRDVKIIGLNDKQAFRIKRSKNWHHVFSFCKEKFAEMNKHNLMTDTVIASRVMGSIGSGIAQHIVKDWNEICPIIVDGEFKTTIEKIFNVYSASKGTKLTAELISKCAMEVDSTFSEKTEAAAIKLIEGFNKTMNRNAMLRLVDWTKVSAKDVSMIVEYVNFVAKS